MILIPTLKERGITNNQSSDWQRIDNIPEKKFGCVCNYKGLS